MGNKKKLVNIIYKPGDLVFAKVKGYPYWPARIEQEPNNDLPKGQYKVFFYGTHETYNLKPNLILPFEENKDKLGASKKSRGFNDGMLEIQNEPNIVSLKNDQILNDQNSDINSNQSETESTNSSNEADIKKPTKPESIKPSHATKRRSETLTDDQQEDKKQKFDDKATNLPTSGDLRKKLIEDTKMRWINLTQQERDEEKLILKRKKLEEKKREKLKSIRIQLALLRMDREIKKSLTLDNTDEKRCCLIMEDLLKLPFLQKHLFKCPEIVETIKKCRKYKNSEEVRKHSLECFYKFQYMFDIPPGETFWSVFEKEREKYLAENVEELKKERNFANKLQLEVGPASTASTITNNNKQQKIIERSRSTSTNSMLNVILNHHHHHVCNIESPLSSTTSSINHSPLSASSNHSTNNS